MLITQIEVRISLKHFGFFLSVRLYQKVYGYIFIHGSAIVLSRKLLLASKLLFLVTRTNEEIGRYNFWEIFFLVISTTEEIGRRSVKGIGYVMSPLSYKVSRNAKSLRHSVKEY